MKKEGAREMKGGAAGSASTWVCKVLAFLLSCATVGEVSAQTGTTVVLDTFATTITMSPAFLELPENGSKSYTLTVNQPPSLDDEELDLLLVSMRSAGAYVKVIPEVLRFTPDDWSEERTITVHGAGDPDRNDYTAQIFHHPTGYGKKGTTQGDRWPLPVNIFDVDSLAMTVVSANQGVRDGRGTMLLSEGESGTYEVVLNRRPPDDVTVTVELRYSRLEVATVSPARLTFSSANWNSPQGIAVQATTTSTLLEGPLYIGYELTSSHHATPRTFLWGDRPPTPGLVALNIMDDDTDDTTPAGVTFSTRRLELNEGEIGTYTVKLNTRPAGDTTVQPASDNPAVKVSPATLTFTTTNWNTAQTVTVRAVRDGDANDETVTLTHPVRGYGNVTDGGAVTVSVKDADTPGVTFSTKRLELNEGETGTYTVKLNTRPAGDVTVFPESSNDDIVTVDPSTRRLTFTTESWNTAQTVTVRAMPDDTFGEGSIRTTVIVHRVTGYRVPGGRAIPVRITYYGENVLPKKDLLPVLKGVWRRIFYGPIEVIGGGRRKSRHVSIGVRGFRSNGGSTITLGGRTIALAQDATPALAVPDTEWRSTPNADLEGETWWNQSLGVGELLRSSAFELSLGTAEDGAQTGGPPQFTLWGEGDFQFFDNRPGAGLRYDGNLKAGYMGVESWFDERWLAGVAVSRTEVATDYTRLQAGGSHEDGRLDVKLTTAYPYLRFASDQRSEFWMLLGTGRGEVTNKRVKASAPESSNVRTLMIAGGARWALTTEGDVDVALLGDAGYGHLSSNSGPQSIDDLSIGSWQARLGVEGSYTVAFERGSSLTPFAEVAVRYDGGGGDRDAGLEIASGVSWENPASGFGVEARGRVMLLHSTDSYREYGASLTASLSPGTGGEGLSLLLSPRLGVVAEGSDALWRDDAFTHATSSGGKAMSLNARMGYGIRDAVVSGLLTPFTEFDLGERGRRRVRMGMRFDRGGSGLGALSLELSGELRESSGSDPEHRIGLIGRLHF